MAQHLAVPAGPGIRRPHKAPAQLHTTDDAPIPYRDSGLVRRLRGLPVTDLEPLVTARGHGFTAHGQSVRRREKTLGAPTAAALNIKGVKTTQGERPAPPSCTRR